MSEQEIIKASQLIQARNLLNISIQDVSREIGVDTIDVLNWEKGKTSPNLRQLESLSKIYGRDIDYFLKITPSPPKNLEFRGKPGRSLRDLSKETKLVLANFDEHCRTIYEFEKLLNKTFTIRISKFKEDYSIEKSVSIFRDTIKVIDKPLSRLREVLENQGFRIFEFSIPNDEFSGFSYWHTDYGPCVLLNAGEPIGRRNFTLAHELAHLLFNHGSSVCFITSKISKQLGSIEYKANQFAVELLLPEFKISDDFARKGLTTRPTWEDIRKIAYKWGVSTQALGYRFENLGLIERGHTDNLVEPKKAPVFRRPKVPRWERQLGKYYVRTSFEAHKKDMITVSKLAHALQLPISKTVEEAKKRIKSS